MKEAKQILIIALCFFVAVFGLYMQFFASNRDNPDEEQKEAVTAESEAGKEENEYHAPEGTYIGLTEEEPAEKNRQPVPEEELEPQTYGDGDVNVYFTGLEEMQADDMFLPYQGYADMASATVGFLEQQTEVDIPKDGSYTELCFSSGMMYRKNNLISFHCYFTDIDTELEIEYVYDDSAMEYIDIHFVPKGEWKLIWKK